MPVFLSGFPPSMCCLHGAVYTRLSGQIFEDMIFKVVVLAIVY